jgi:hypothetical protein
MTTGNENAEPSIEEILAQLNLRGPYPQAQYVSTMERRFGTKGARFMDEVDRGLVSEPNLGAWNRLY